MHEALLAGLLLGLVTACVYAPHVIRGGWYYDDWMAVARMRDAAPGGLSSLWDTATAMSYRPGYAVVFIGLYAIGGAGQSPYLAVGAVLTALEGSLFYLVLRSMGMRRPLAGVAAVLLVVLPSIDAVRLWTAAFPITVSACLYFTGLLSALRGLDAVARPSRVAWHVVAALLYVTAILTYEGVAGLLLVTPLLYLIRGGRRSLMWRLPADWLVLGIGLAIMGPRARDRRPAHAALDYLLHRAEGMWTPAQQVFRGLVPWSEVLAGPVGLALGLAAAVGLGVALGRGGPPADRVRVWLGVGGLGVAFGLAGLVVLLPADTYYVPRPSGIGDRLGAFAAPGAVLLLMAVVVLVPIGIAVLVRRVRLGYAAAAVLLMITTVNLAVREVRQQGPWADAWHQEQVIVASVKDAIGPTLPRGAAVVTFRHTTQLLPADVPVFSATWDLRGALWQAYDRPWVNAFPWMPGTRCERAGLALPNERAATPGYEYPHLIFVDVSSRVAEPIASQHECAHAIARLTS